jgi:hypothetical protein
MSRGSRNGLPLKRRIVAWWMSRSMSATAWADEGNTFPAGSLGSTGVTRLRRYYEPLRLPTRPSDGYLFPPSVERPAPADPLTGPVLSGSWTTLSVPADLSRPGEPDRCTCSLLHGRWQASCQREVLATPNGFTRPNQVHAISADTFAFPGFVSGGRPPPRRVRFMVHEQLPWSVPFN